MLNPPPLLKISEWADFNRRLSREASAEPGGWDTSRAEYQRGIMDAVCDDSIESVVVMSSAQVGKTEIELNIIGYYIDQDPSPILVVYPTETMAKAFSEDRLATMLRDTPCLQGKVKDPRARDSKNTKLHKMFPGGHITMVGANSPSNLASRPIRIVLFDEVDRFPVSAGGSEGEGDVITLATKRSQTFFNRKTIMVSTPTIKDLSRIELAYEASDQRKFFVPCGHCGEYQVLRWANVHWEKDDQGEHKPETAAYVCEHCGVIWSEKERHVQVKKGEWRATKEFTGVAGFNLNELYSPWSSLARIVKNFIEAKKTPELLKAFVNTSLGETWEEAGEHIDDGGLISRREEYQKVPAGVGVLVASADIQADRIESLVVGVGVDSEVWGIEHKVFYGDPALPAVWESLKEYLNTRFEHESGQKVPIACACIDSGDHTQDVYRFVRSHQGRRIYAIKGSSQLSNASRPIVGMPSRGNVQHVTVFPIATDTAKDILFSRLKVQTPGPAYIHFNYSFSEDFFDQLSAEKRVVKYYKGFPRREYVKIKKRNEAIDLFVYCLAAYEILNVQNIKRRVEALAVKPAAANEVKQGPVPQRDITQEMLKEQKNRITSKRPGRNWVTGGIGQWKI